MFHAYHILFVCSYLQVKNILTTMGKAVFWPTFKEEIPYTYVEI